MAFFSELNKYRSTTYVLNRKFNSRKTGESRKLYNLDEH